MISVWHHSEMCLRSFRMNRPVQLTSFWPALSRICIPIDCIGMQNQLEANKSLFHWLLSWGLLKKKIVVWNYKLLVLLQGFEWEIHQLVSWTHFLIKSITIVFRLSSCLAKFSTMWGIRRADVWLPRLATWVWRWCLAQELQRMTLSSKTTMLKWLIREVQELPLFAPFKYAGCQVVSDLRRSSVRIFCYFYTCCRLVVQPALKPKQTGKLAFLKGTLSIACLYNLLWQNHF